VQDCDIEPGPLLERLRRYAELLIHWNRSVSNLLSRNDEHRLVERHLGEALGPLREIRAARIERWLDIGSGGGLPAIPLALAGIGNHWTLVESRRMKTLFIRKAKQELGLENVDVVCSRIESLELGTPVRGVTSRATLHLGPTLEQASRFTATGSKAFLWKGERRSEEMRADPAWRERWMEAATIGQPFTPTVIVVFDNK
jgi:16S rRNA (guanine527-N7)-methyltransferase